MTVLSGKVALVTGASKGIGAGIAKHLAACGANVAVNYATSREGADRVVAEIENKGGQAVAIKGDVSKTVEVERIFNEIEAALGRVDIHGQQRRAFSSGSAGDCDGRELPSKFRYERSRATAGHSASGGTVRSEGELASSISARRRQRLRAPSG